jgi:predicted phosphodiesterase
MSRTLVISDIHNRHVQAQILIDKVPCDRIVLLGDYFDNFSDSVCDAHNTAVWLKESILSNSKITPLIGNHDAAYFWPACTFLRCSGFTEPKMQAIRRVLPDEDMKHKFKVFTTDQNFVLSHAGLSNKVWKELNQFQTHIDIEKTKLDSFVSALDEYVKKNINMLELVRHAPLFAAGWDRGGEIPNGGITWMDWKNFAPIKGINQIVGHTPVFLPEFMIQLPLGTVKRFSVEELCKKKNLKFDDATSINLDLDTHSNHYAIIEDGKVEIYDTNTQKSVREMIANNVPLRRATTPVIMDSAWMAIFEDIQRMTNENKPK